MDFEALRAPGVKKVRKVDRLKRKVMIRQKCFLGLKLTLRMVFKNLH